LIPQRAAELRKLFEHYEYPWTSGERDAYERLYAIALTKIAFTAKLLWDRDVLPDGFIEYAKDEAKEAKGDTAIQAAEDVKSIDVDAYTETQDFKKLAEALSDTASRRSSRT